jgi:hypothetical protein
MNSAKKNAAPGATAARPTCPLGSVCSLSGFKLWLGMDWPFQLKSVFPCSAKAKKTNDGDFMRKLMPE